MACVELFILDRWPLRVCWCSVLFCCKTRVRGNGSGEGNEEEDWEGEWEGVQRWIEGWAQQQTQPQAQYAAYQPYNAAGAAAASMTKSQIMIIIIVVEAIAIIAAIFGMKSFVGSKLSARAYAQKYFVSVANDDIKAAFELTDIKKSDLVNEDTFENYLAQQTDYGHAKSYKVTSDFQDDIYQIVNIDYESSISGNTSSCYVKMIGDSKKKMGIFDTWKVSMGDIFTNNYS